MSTSNRQKNTAGQSPGHTQIKDIKQIEIDQTLPLSERMQNYLQQVKNPYDFICGDVTVHIQYASQGQPLSNLISNYLISKKSGR